MNGTLANIWGNSTSSTQNSTSLSSDKMKSMSDIWGSSPSPQDKMKTMSDVWNAPPKNDAILPMADGSESPLGSFVKTTSGALNSFSKNLATGEVNATKSIGNTASKIGEDINTNIKLGEDAHNNGAGAVDSALLQGGKDITDIGGDVAKGGATAIMKLISPFIPKDVKDSIKEETSNVVKTISDLLDKPITDNPSAEQGRLKVNEILHSLSNVIDPETQKTIGNGIAMILAPSAIEGGINAGKTVLNAADTTAGAIKTGIDTVVPIAKSVAQDAKDSVAGLGSNLKTSVGDAISGKVKSVFKGKTEAEILATPESDVYKLSPNDRKVFYDAQRTQIDNAQSAFETKIKADTEAKVSELQSQTQDLQNQADRASIEEAQSLKPKVIQSMAENSSTYRKLVDEEISQHTDVPIKADEVKQFIENRFAEDQGRAQAITERLGLNEPATEVPKKGELPTIQAKSNIPDTTVGKIYDNLKSLKQDIGSAARKGSRTFTPDEKLTDDSISTLSDFLKSKGVDLSEANKFWRNYAPLRDKIIKSVQPFTPRGSETGTFKTFTKIIQNSIKGVDEGNKDFISATEDLLGKKIGNKEVRNALSKLDANEKAQIAARIDKENAISDAKLRADLESKKIDDKAFESDRKAQTKANVVSALKWVLGTGVSIEAIKQLF